MVLIVSTSDVADFIEMTLQLCTIAHIHNIFTSGLQTKTFSPVAKQFYQPIVKDGYQILIGLVKK